MATKRKEAFTVCVPDLASGIPGGCHNAARAWREACTAQPVCVAPQLPLKLTCLGVPQRRRVVARCCQHPSSVWGELRTVYRASMAQKLHDALAVSSIPNLGSAIIT
eukprot:CAMPEP_0172751624 /NCGR_PEP_ID=MMETSP1074-20121228/152153_1 /TAXON_ID=2916 /ORGANISM="Ceratium fusus, Strain PA161109" /LENGTH=106 /DNA_ID=CAMNT_0013584009 /DNA_START=317 /DNA_END=637 /DNA_ORIENTATION=-